MRGTARVKAVRRLEEIRGQIDGLLGEAIEIVSGGSIPERPPTDGEPWVRTTKLGVTLHWEPIHGRWVSIPRD